MRRLATTILILALLANSLTTLGETLPRTQSVRREVTVDYLYEACAAVGKTARGDIPFFDCASYVYGVLDAYIAVRDRIPSRERACFPAGIAPWRVLKMANPKPGTYNRSQTAAAFLLDFLKRRFPCSVARRQ